MIGKIILALRFILGPFCLLIGVDKFLMFLEECTLQAGTSPTLWKITGVLQILIGLSILFNKGMNIALILALVIFSSAIYSHVSIETTDIGGAIFLAMQTILLLGLNVFQKSKSDL